jgi:transketolase C-terminal domain/subunit
MALEDLAFFRTLPNGVVLIPSDAVSTEKAV